MTLPRHVHPLCLSVAILLASCSDHSSPTDLTGSPEDPHVAWGLVDVQTPDGELDAGIAAPDNVSTLGEVDVTMTLDDPTQAGPMEIVFVMDASGSMKASGWAAEKAMVTDLVHQLPPSAYLGVVQFASESYKRHTFNNNQNRAYVAGLVQSLDFLESETATLAAVDDAVDIFQTTTRGLERLLILITDGNPNPSSTQNPCGTTTAARNLREELHELNVRVVLVAAGPDINPGTLSCLYNNDPARVVTMPSLEDADIDAAVDDVLRAMDPPTENVVFSGTIAPDFELVSGPAKADAVTFPGDADPATSSYDPATRRVTWTVGHLDGRERVLRFRVRAGADACGPETLVSDLNLTYSVSGAAHTPPLEDLTIAVTGCAPVITPVLVGTLGDDGWYTSDVEVGWNITHDEIVTGLENCLVELVSEDTQGVEFPCVAHHAGGSATGSAFVKRDATPPVITVTGNAGTYTWGQTIAIACVASDATSGIAEDGCVSTNAPASGFAAGPHTIEVSARDRAGNTTVDHYTFEIVVDVTPPEIASSVAGTLGNNGWYVSNVGVSWTVEDAESTVASQTGCGPVTVVADTHGATFTCQAASAGGGASKAVTIKRDASAPAIVFAGNLGAYGAADLVAITCSVSDATSGLATSTCPGATAPAWSFGLGSHTLSASAKDNAGNEATAAATFTVGVDLGDMQTLISASVTGPGAAGVANSLMAKLRGPRPNVAAFINEVRAQTGKRITAEMAAVLIALAGALGS